jgi:hypothetical protein
MGGINEMLTDSIDASKDQLNMLKTNQEKLIKSVQLQNPSQTERLDLDHERDFRSAIYNTKKKWI